MKYNVENGEYINAPNGKRYRMATDSVGNNFGQVGVLVAKNGKVVAVTDNVYPTGAFRPPLSEFQKLVEKLS